MAETDKPKDKVEMATDELGEVEQRPMPNFSSMPDTPRMPTSPTNGGVVRGATPWNEEIDATDLLERAAMPPEDALNVVDGDLNPQPVSKELVAVSDIPAHTLVPVVVAEEETVFTDGKTPAHGTAAPEVLHSGISLPDEAPVEDAAPTPLPPMPGSKSVALIESEDMNEKDKADPKTDAMELRAVKGMLRKSDALLMRSRTKKPFEKERERIRAKQRVLELEDQQVVLVQQRWELTEQHAQELQKQQQLMANEKTAVELHEIAKAEALELKKVSAAADAAFEKEMSDLGVRFADVVKNVRSSTAEEQLDTASEKFLDIWRGLVLAKRKKISSIADHKRVVETNMPLIQQINSLKEDLKRIPERLSAMSTQVAEIDEKIAAIVKEIGELEETINPGPA